MATDHKKRILDWCGADSSVRCVGEESDPGAAFTLVLESAGTEMTAALPSGADRLVLRSVIDLGQARRPAAGDLAAGLADLEERRPGPVTAGVDADAGQVEVASWVVLDGLTKHSLLTAVSDVIRTRRAALRLAGLPADETATSRPGADLTGVPAPGSDLPSGDAAPAGVAISGPSVEPIPGVSATAPEAGTTVPAPWEWPPGSGHPAPAATDPARVGQPEEPAVGALAFRAEERAPAPSPWSSPEATVFEPLDTHAQGFPASPAYGATPGGSGQGYEQGYSPAAEQASAPSPAPAQQPWTPSHRVPPQGMQAWAAPDPAGAVIATLGGHLPVQVTEVRGAWAHIVCSNGWTGWVDDRLLVVGA
jgi:hypothetical protein